MISEQVNLLLLPRKNGNGGHHGGRPHELALTADLKKWRAALDAAEALRREQVRQVAQLRAEVYQLAKARGLTPTMLRAACRLMRK
jgi:hypothetical protein